MTIERFRAWGAPGALPAEGVVVHSDAEAGAVVAAAMRAGEPVPALGLLGGDLCRTLGGTGDEGRLRSSEAMTFPCDLGVALLDGSPRWFVAHLVARRGWWRGRATIAANAAWLGEWNIAPKSHPDDGQLDVIEARVAAGERLKVRSRLPLGDHLPHPGIATRRARDARFSFDRPLPVRLDGVHVGSFADVSVHAEPDAITVVV